MANNIDSSCSRADRGSRTLILACVTTLLSACGGSSGGGNAEPGKGPEPGNPSPTLSFSGSPSSVAAGGRPTLTWSSTNTERCDASGGWSGARARSGSETVEPISSATTYRLNCSGAGGSVAREVTIQIGAELAVDLTVSPTQIAVDDSATLSWSSTGASSCTASGGWSGARDLSGSYGTGPLTSSRTYSLSCSNGRDNALASVTVEVLDKVVRWRAPTRNVDGTALTDLGGYVVYWGTTSRSYIGSHTIDSPSITVWEADIAPGSYFFALTAFDGEGNESDYSNELQKIIP